MSAGDNAWPEKGMPLGGKEIPANTGNVPSGHRVPTTADIPDSDIVSGPNLSGPPAP